MLKGKVELVNEFIVHFMVEVLGYELILDTILFAFPEEIWFLS